MAGKGRRNTFHGAFKSKAKAQRRERSRKGSYIREVKIRKQRRFLVMKPR
jgi:hypothetical protein